eukprot:scaffold201_cov121-Isochrysis_galbana.AAC.12
MMRFVMRGGDPKGTKGARPRMHRVWTWRISAYLCRGIDELFQLIPVRTDAGILWRGSGAAIWRGV